MKVIEIGAVRSGVCHIRQDIDEPCACVFNNAVSLIFRAVRPKGFHFDPPVPLSLLILLICEFEYE